MDWIRQRYGLLAGLLLLTAATILWPFATHGGATAATSPDFLAPEERNWLREHGDAIRLAPDPYFPPMEYFDQHGELRGIAVEYVRLLEEKLQARFTIVRLSSFEEVLESARTRSVDVAATVIETPERAAYLRFTPPYIHIPNVIVVRDDHTGDMTPEKLKHLPRVVYQGGYAIGDVLRERHGLAHLQPVTDPAQALRDLSTGRIDAMVGNLATISWYARQANLTNLRVAGDCEYDDALAFASRSDQPVLHAILTKALGRITDAERDAIRDRWIRLQPLPFYRQTEFWLFVAGAVALFLAVIGLFSVWNRTLARQVARKTAELQQKNEEMTRFLNTVSHDLKSPLVTIRTFLHFVEKDLREQNTELVLRNLKFMHMAADKMGHLLDELLELSRIGHGTVQKEEIALQDVVRHALALVAGRLASAGVEVTVTDRPVVLYGEVRRLVALYQNLIDNAVKYMGAQDRPRIEIGVVAENREMALFVRDNGEGIAPEARERLFGIFEKIHPDSEGVGMGLAIVKRIVETHGGTIRAESDGTGKGTAFYFTLAGTREARA